VDRLGEALAKARAKRGWTQEEAAHQIDIGLRHYQQLEAGEANATITTLARLCAGLKVDIRELF
jgi:transcriptional regulator with XRE-family HTH domain